MRGPLCQPELFGCFSCGQRAQKEAEGWRGQSCWVDSRLEGAGPAIKDCSMDRAVGMRGDGQGML